MTDAGSESLHPFDALSPDVILDAVDAAGWLTDGRFLALNSYENRVYQVGVEDQTPVIVKFYRPERWSDAQILEEHAFAAELVSHELPVVAPLSINGKTLLRHEDYRFSVYPRRGGHAPPLDDPDALVIMGRYLALLHNVGAVKPFEHRPTLDLASFGIDAVAHISEHWIPDSLREAYTSLTRDLLATLTRRFEEAGTQALIRTHGDCHGGNVLWRDDLPSFVDLDDARMAPAMQDIWMLLSGEAHEQQRQLMEIAEGYNEFRDFPVRELNLIEPLRTLRILHFCHWIAQRWDDPAFPKAFPWFGSERFWGEHILELRNQLAALQAPALTLPRP
ncbi:MAG: serine/threonine protein kinase [Alcanivoracaceae bacterium]